MQASEAQKFVYSPSSPVTILSLFSGDIWAGAEKMIFALLKGLSKDPDLKIVALAFNEGVLVESLRSLGIEVIVLDESRHSIFGLLLRAYRLFRGRGIQLIHSHGYKANILAWLLSRLVGGARLVATVHSLPEAAFRESGLSQIADKVKRLLEDRILRRSFSRVIVVSQDIRNVLIRDRGYSAASTELIYNGIELPLHRPEDMAARPQCVHVGNVGRLVPVKDFPLFIRIATEIRAQVSNVRFSVLGDGPMKEELVRLVKDLKMETHIQFETPRPDPLPYFHSLDIYLNTSVHEGLPLSILEAMACGRPVVAPCVGGIPEIITNGEDGLLVKSGDVAEFVAACLQLIRSDALRQRLGAKAVQRVSAMFSSEGMTMLYRTLYHRVVDGVTEPVGQL